MKKHIMHAVLCSSLLTPLCAMADVDRINSPIVTEGEFEAYYNATRTDDGKGSKTNKQVNEFAFEYGLTDDWKFEGGFELKRSDKDDADPTNFFIEFVRELTNQEDGWMVSSGLLTEYVRDLDGDSDKVKLSGLFQHLSDKWQHRLNINLSEEFQKEGSKAKVVTRWGTYYKYTKLFQPGFEWHAAYGDIGDLELNEDQEHFVGPVVKSKFASWESEDGTPHELSLLFGHMFNASNTGPDATSRLKFEYTTQF